MFPIYVSNIHGAAQKDLESQNDFERALGPARYKLNGHFINGHLRLNLVLHTLQSCIYKS